MFLKIGRDTKNLNFLEFYFNNSYNFVITINIIVIY